MAKKNSDYLGMKGIYKKAPKGWPVPRINVPYEEPKMPELVIETDKVSVRQSKGGLSKN